MLSSSRGLAQISSRLGADFKISTAADMSGTGSLPVSAMRPANTEMQQGVLAATHIETSRTCSSVITAVTFTLIPPHDSFLISSNEGCRRVLVIGIFT